jgi:hypothetical protein
MRERSGITSRTARWTGIGAAIAGAVGGVVGLVIGLAAHPATAWFAIFELGVPAALVGALVGLVAGAIADVVRRVRHAGA